MKAIFAEVISLLKSGKEERTVNSLVFDAMKFAMTLSLASCILCTLKDYIGDNINCITGFSENEHRAIETYCFISSTYSVVNLTEGESPHYGVGPYNPANGTEDIKEHAYYQWVSFMLAFQTAAFYFPRWVWRKVLDKSKFQAVIGKLDALQIIEVEERKEGNSEGDEEKTRLKEVESHQLRCPPQIVERAEYMAKSIGTHTPYALAFLSSEMLCFAIALGNLFMTDAFLGGGFKSYGQDAWQYITGDITDMDNPLNRVFPKVTKCNWYKYGPTGTIQTYDALCVLPLNIINEKTYIVLWFTYLITFIVVSLVLLLHLSELFIKPVRHSVTLQRIKGKQEKEYYKQIQNKLNYGDWFILNQLSKSMMENYFIQWLKQVHDIITQ